MKTTYCSRAPSLRRVAGSKAVWEGSRGLNPRRMVAGGDKEGRGGQCRKQ